MHPDTLLEEKFTENRNLFNTYKAKFFDLLNSTVPAKGKEFPKIIGPNPNDKVCIVGAGPAGLHMALSLKDKGYKKIRIFEKTNRHGGKCYDTTIDGVYRPQGAIFMTADYVDNVIALGKRFNAGEIKLIDQAGVRNLFIILRTARFKKGFTLTGMTWFLIVYILLLDMGQKQSFAQ